ncbi:MAG TPA: hypothetical protein VJT67_17970 [Longimicrobiaceae bacterium]|nr:hypothetical protein [Longimicrobiaceae bacterium]
MVVAANSFARQDTAPSPFAADAPPPGFQFRPAVEPDTVTVGDRFVTGAAIGVPAGTRVTIEVPKDSADRWRVVGRITATAEDSARTRWLVVVPMVAWTPGLDDAAGARVRLAMADGRTLTIAVGLLLPTVRAVLPADSTKWVVKPPHDVWGPSRDWRVDALMGLLALLLLGAIAWLVRWIIRRRRKRAGPLSARQQALATLERAGKSGFIEAANWKAFYTLVSEALRGYAAALSPRWSSDLTSTELLEAMETDGVPADDAAALERLLRVADLAKFARHGRAPDDARRDLVEARTWVEAFAAPSPETAEAEAEAEPAGAP